jgi:hypothetical protein
MPRPKTINLTPAAVSTNNICLSQTPGAAGNLLLNGTTAGTLDYARKLVLTAVSNESAKTFTFTGKDADGIVISEVVTGPNATTANTVNKYLIITSIAVSAATTGAVTVGTTSDFVSKTFPLNRHVEPMSVGFGVDISGTINYTVEHTFDEVQSVLGASAASWYPHASIASQTADKDGSYLYSVNAIRLHVNSYSTGATAKFSIVQGGPR